MQIFIGILISYLVGSVPTAYIYGRLVKNIDIRQHGSGNVGATNVFRVFGRGPGILVLLLDILKGVISVTVVGDFLGLNSVVDRILLAVAVVCGHNWTVFLKFKGGKGIATSLGVLIGLTLKIAMIRPVLLFTLIIFLTCLFATGYVSLSSIVASVALPVIMILTNQTVEIVALGIIFCIFVVFRHRPNIKRLFSGQEPRVPILHHKKQK